MVADWISSFDTCASVEELASQRTEALASARKAKDQQAWFALDAAARKRKVALETKGVTA